MYIGAVVVCPGGGGGGSERLGGRCDVGGADRVDCEAGGPDWNLAEFGPEPLLISRAASRG